jgi:hypothetical protein
MSQTLLGQDLIHTDYKRGFRQDIFLLIGMFIVFSRLPVPPYWKYKFCFSLVTLQIES